MGFNHHIIRSYCHSINIPIKEFAEQIGISKTHLFNYIDGKNNISETVAKRIEALTQGKLNTEELLALNKSKKKE